MSFTQPGPSVPLSSGNFDAAAWRRSAQLLRQTGDLDGADAAQQSALRASTRDPVLVGAALALRDGRLAEAERVLRARLKAMPTDVAAIRMLAEVAAQLGRYDDSVLLLERVLELSPGFEAARYHYALVLQRLNRSSAALAEIELLLRNSPQDPRYRLSKASVLVRLGEYVPAIVLYEALLVDQPAFAPGWMSLGHVLKTVGRASDCITAYRRAVSIAPQLGEAWWSLANLKTFRFSDDDIALMRREIVGEELREEDRLHLNFALGKALEDAGGADELAFEHYSRGAAIRSIQLAYDPEHTTRSCERAKALFSGTFLAERKGRGCRAVDPIFIVGLPRAGSTLVEQILASHPLIEGTMELPDIMAMAHRLEGMNRSAAYPEVLAGLDEDDLRALGEEYLARTRVQRKSYKPFFIDKMPNNWLHIGLIHLILPNAKIIDVRRHPMACCFANFKQHFARGQAFSYSLDHLGRYYRDYAALMAHFDRVLPGLVHRIGYEELITDTEPQVRKLLAYCGLPFDPACLNFHQTDRAVRTASAEQVRQPIYRSSLDQWRRFERWLGPLADALHDPTLVSRSSDATSS
jgi:tetratricopeptide (TPR) repeat protein